MFSYPFALILPLFNPERQQSILLIKLSMYVSLLLYFHNSVSFLVSFSLVCSALFWLFRSFHGVLFHVVVLLLNTCNCHPLSVFLLLFYLVMLFHHCWLLDQAKIELITSFLGRNCHMDFMKGECLQIQKSANIMYVSGAFWRNRRSKKYIEEVKNGNS